MAFRLWMCFVVVLAVSHRLAAAGADAVVVLPVKAQAFDQIETGIRLEFGRDIDLRILLASDFEGKPGGVVEAAHATHPDLILPLGTGMSRMFVAAAGADTPPVLCIAVTNPADVLRADQLEPPRQLRATVVTDGPARIYMETADLIAALYPRVGALGTVWNPAEANSVANYERIQQEASRHGWKVAARQISNAEDIEPAARSLVEAGAQAVWISKDRLMTSSPARLIEICHGRGVPVFCSDAGTVERFHALGTSSVAFEDLGRYIGRLARRIILEKVDVRTIPVSTLEETKVFLSRPAIDVLNIQIPDQIARRAVFLGDSARAAPSSRSNWTWPILGLFVIVAIGGLVVVLARRRRPVRPEGSETAL